MTFMRRLFGDGGRGPTEEGPPGVAEAEVGETATVRRIVARLEALPPDEARYLAGYSYILARVAHADMDISEAETRAMERLLVEFGALDEPQAVLVTEMAKFQARSVGATEDYLVTREFRDLATLDQRLAVLRAAFAVGAADESISAAESAAMSQIGSELALDPAQVAGVRSEFHEKLSVVQAIRRLR